MRRRAARRGIPIVVAALLLHPLFPLPAAAQILQKPEQGPATAAPAAQAPPLFPKHRRGMYLNNEKIDVIDATPQSPPLDIDDPGVPDQGEFEINLLTAADFSDDLRRIEMLRVDANYGVVLKSFGHELPTQLKFEIPIAAARAGGNPYEIGMGRAAFGLKFNFYNDENRGLRLSIYPQLEFATSGSAEKDLAEKGQTIVVPLLLSKESKLMTLVANATIEKPVHNAGREATGELSVGAGRAFFRKLAVMGDLHGESTFDFKRDRQLSINGGVIYGVRKAIWYARLGHTLLSDEGPHTFFAVGMKLLIDTRD